MRNSTLTKAVAGVAVIGAGIAAGVGIANATSGGDDGSETPITGEALDRASEVALNHTGSGRVTETEVGDEESFYEVEVTLTDGRQIDVQLDESFVVVGEEVETGPDDD